MAILLMAVNMSWAQSGSVTTPAAAQDPNAYLWGQINHAKDPNNMTILEQEHVPGIYVDGPVVAGQPVNVTVRVGEGIMHPSLHDHFIQWIELYNGDLQLGHADLVPATTKPEVTFTIVLNNSTTLRALENCNLHGTWENTKNVTVNNT
jgi:superoxide reductase